MVQNLSYMHHYNNFTLPVLSKIMLKYLIARIILFYPTK